MSLPRLACTLGDPAGVGPEVVLRALAEQPLAAEPVLVGDPELWTRRADELGIELNPMPEIRPLEAGVEEIRVGHPTEACGAAALASLEAAVTMVERGEADALMTAPVNKELVARCTKRFRGHTEWLAARAGISDPTMLFAAPRDSDGARGADIALLTTHLPLVSALTLVRVPTVARMLVRVDRQWAETFGRRPHIGLAALNPHAGEAGLLGSEEGLVLAPAMRIAREQGVEITGPYPADSVFLRDGIDVILALYHDQGTIMAKRAPWPTVNLTLGLPYVRTSPDHGTAYALAVKGGADWRPTAAALALAATLASRKRDE